MQKDSGYAWVVLLSSMVINFMCIGFCFGIISVLTYEYQVEFGADLTQVSWIGSALIAVLLVSGKFVESTHHYVQSYICAASIATQAANPRWGELN